MKRLYNCSAWCNQNDLRSYETLIIRRYYKLDNTEVIEYRNFRTMTTLMHIRKYMKWLEERKCYRYADRLRILYIYSMKHREKRGFVMIDGAIQDL